MKTVSTLYEGKVTIERLVEQGELSPHLPYFVQLATASQGPEETLAIAQFVQARFPAAVIIGFSASGLIYKGVQHPEGTLLLFQLFEKTSVFPACFTWEGKSAAEVAAEVADAIADKPARLMHVICGNHYYDVHGFVEEFNRRNSSTILVGGVAGDILQDNTEGFVLTPEGVLKNGIVTASLCGHDFSFYNGVNTSHEPISGKHKLTGMQGDTWTHINGQDIREWLFEQLGLEKLESYTDWEVLCANDELVRFPMMLESYPGASRFLRYDLSQDGITQYFSQVPLGTEFRIGYVNPSECVQESFRLCNEIMEQPIEELFCYTCLFRRLYLHNCADWELSPYKNVELCGAFMMGEISSVNGVNEFLNGSCCLVGIAENEVYIRPDIQAFRELKGIEDDTKDLLNIVLKRQQEATSRQNEQLMQTLLAQQESHQKHIYIDFNTGMANYLKYKEDLKESHFDKLCIAKIENAELLITHLGHTAYQQLTRKTLEQIQAFIQELCSREHTLLDLYIFNESSFFIAADERMSESHFMRICESLHEAYHFFHTEGEEVLVNRFVVCLNQKDPIESALNSLAASKNTQNSFLVCKNDDEGVSSSDEFAMIGVLNRAFENDGVVPYFQGIYCNKKKVITHYEALMRIQDVDGTVYPPAQFISVAKKYHMYTLLSTKMLNKVFDLFSGRNEMVSMNISAFDIQSEPTVQMIFDRLKNCQSPGNFVFEILEDEAYRDFAPLKEFIWEVRKLGAKVAIDDFGAGYSNLYEISSISFDIIKVDGGIIRNLPSNECNRRLLEVITHMGLLFKAEIVAEFVENQTIQDLIVQTGINYSQGYLFSVPLPFEALDLPG